MKNYIIKPGTRGLFSVDVEKMEFDATSPITTHIDWIYTIDEDGVLNLPNNEKKDVKKGDLVVLFYDSPYTKNIAIVINNEEWKENIAAEREYAEKQRCANCKDCDECLGDCQPESISR